MQCASTGDAPADLFPQDLEIPKRVLPYRPIIQDMLRHLTHTSSPLKGHVMAGRRRYFLSAVLVVAPARSQRGICSHFCTANCAMLRPPPPRYGTRSISVRQCVCAVGVVLFLRCAAGRLLISPRSVTANSRKLDKVLSLDWIKPGIHPLTPGLAYALS